MQCLISMWYLVLHKWCYMHHSKSVHKGPKCWWLNVVLRFGWLCRWQMWLKSPQIILVIQIKICAEYRYMLPRPPLDLSGTPGLRPIGLSPGSWQTSLGLGSTDLNLFYSIHFWFFFISLWVWLGTLQDCHHAQCPLPLSIVIRMRLVIRQSKLPACLADVQLAHENNRWH